MNAAHSFIEDEFQLTENHALRGEHYSEKQLDDPNALEPQDAIDDIRQLQVTRIVKELLLTVFREPAHTDEVVELDNEGLISLAGSRLLKDEKINAMYVRGFVDHLMESRIFENKVDPDVREIHRMAKREFERVLNFLRGKKFPEKKRVWRPQEKNYRRFVEDMREKGVPINLD